MAELIGLMEDPGLGVWTCGGVLPMSYGFKKMIENVFFHDRVGLMTLLEKEEVVGRRGCD